MIKTKEEILAQIEKEEQEQIIYWQSIASQQRKCLGNYFYRRCGASFTDTVVLRFPDKQRFYEFVQFTGAGSYAYERIQPLVILDIANSEAIFEAFSFGARFAYVRHGDRINPIHGQAD